MDSIIGDLIIERGETGFIVYENAGMGVTKRKWAFESGESLSKFVANWAYNYKSTDAKVI